MTDGNLELSRVQTLRRDVLKSIKAGTEGEQTRQKIAELLSAAGDMVTAFNMMRETFSSYLSAAKQLDLDCRAANARFESLAGAGVDIVGAGFAEEASDVEDPEKFKAILVDINGTSNLFRRLAKCRKVNDAIANSIDGWESKLAKLRLRIGAAGVASNESDVAARKIITLERFVEDLRVRGNTITQIYDDTDNAITKAQRDSRGKFKSLYNNKLS